MSNNSFGSFPAYLAKRLEEARTTNAALARSLDISGTAVWNYLRGNMLPKPLLADRIAAYFGDDPNMVRRLCGHPESTALKSVDEAELREYAEAWTKSLSELQSVRERQLAQAIALSMVRTLASA